MHRESPRRARGFLARALARLLLPAIALSPCFGALSADAQIDESINTTVWKLLYGVTDAQASSATWLAADDDGDGQTNGAELAAGTNPFVNGSALAVSASVLNADRSLGLSFPTVDGKLYIVQASGDLTGGGGWNALSPAVQIQGDGLPKTLTAPAPSAQTFYRVLVRDVDTDGDGVSDWAEKVAGFDPANSHSHGAAEDDHTALTNDLVQENVVTVSAVKSTATQPGDAATVATDSATINVTRGGTLHFSSITVPLSWSGTAVSGIDYAALPSSVTFPPKVGTVTLTVAPLYNASRQTAATVTVNVLPGGGYAVGPVHGASAMISPAGNPGGVGLTGSYFNGTAKTVSPYQPTVLFAGPPALTRIDSMLDFNWNSGSPGPGVNASYFGVRWQGQVQPEYTETYYFDVVADDGVKLWVNGQLLIDTWSYVGGDRLSGIALKAGVLYDIEIQYYQYTAADQLHLSWYSNSQTKQVIPSNRLYPLIAAAAPPAIVSAPVAVGFVDQPFNFNVMATSSGGLAPTYALGGGSRPLPPGLTLNGATGLISGTPTAAGDYQVALTASTAMGTGGAVLDLQILNAGSGVTREIWTGLAGAGLGDVPLGATPSRIDHSLTTLEDGTGYGNNTGERLRGYFTAPVTGNYYFWIAGSNAAELWISDDAEPANLIRRAWVTPPGVSAENWNASGQPHQRSPWLSLAAGQSYYYEVRHNTGGSGSSSNLSVAYLQDPTGTATTPSAVIPGYLLAQYDYPTTTAASGTLYITNLSPQGAAASTATGSANLRMLPGNTQAILHFNYGGLSSPRTAYHIHIAPDSTGIGPIVFDLDDVDKFHPELKTADGGYIWNIVASGVYSAAQIVAGIQSGETYFNVHTVTFPNGEIRGFLTLVDGSQTPPTLAADPGYPDDSGADAGAARFLNQAAFGAAPTDLAAVRANGFAAWINNQLALPATHLLPDVQAQILASPNTNLSASMLDNAWWRAAITGADQLRQRTTFALSEILVVSDTNSTLGGRPDALAAYYDTLADHAFGNFRDLLEAATLNPAMGYWLNMQGNAKGNLTTGYHPNENYAREIMQLFSIGLNRLWPDGTLVLDSTGNLVPTYGQSTITNGFARVFTGWTWHQAAQGNGQLPTNFYPPTDWINPMVMVKNYHELGPKSVLDNVVLPGAVGYSQTASALGGSQADLTSAAYDSYCQQDFESGLDNIFYHPNLGPYVCRQLIQRLVESNPSSAYLYRVVAKFDDDGTAAHARGNMTAVIRAILLDGEARNTAAAAAASSSGKQREPLMRIAGPGRTFLALANSGTYSQSGTAVTTITTSAANHFSGGDVVGLDFSGNSGGSATRPTTGSYTVLSTPAPTVNSFAVNAASLASVSCTEAANTNNLTVNTSGPAIGEQIYLKFLTGGFADGIYTVTSVPNGGSFMVTVAGAAPAANVTGSVIVPKGSGYDNIAKAAGTNPNVITIATNSNLNLTAGQGVWIVAGGAAQLKDAAWTVGSVLDERHFTLNNATASYAAETNQAVTIYPLVPPVLTRSGNVNLPSSKFDMGNTNSAIVQSPLDAPTVFNFFYPDYQYPGSLSANNITTPEFQLTTDTNIVTLSNTINSTVLSSSNAKGLSNFRNGSINLDLSAYMGAPYVSYHTDSTTKGTVVTAVTTTSVDTAALIAKLGNLLTGGMFNQNTQAVATLTAFVDDSTNFPVTQTATGTTTVSPTAPTLPTINARDKVRAVVQQILVSPDYAIQR